MPRSWEHLEYEVALNLAIYIVAIVAIAFFASALLVGFVWGALE